MNCKEEINLSSDYPECKADINNIKEEIDNESNKHYKFFEYFDYCSESTITYEN